MLDLSQYSYVDLAPFVHLSDKTIADLRELETRIFKTNHIPLYLSQDTVDNRTELTFGVSLLDILNDEEFFHLNSMGPDVKFAIEEVEKTVYWVMGETLRQEQVKDIDGYQSSLMYSPMDHVVLTDRYLFQKLSKNLDLVQLYWVCFALTPVLTAHSLTMIELLKTPKVGKKKANHFYECLKDEERKEKVLKNLLYRLVDLDSLEAANNKELEGGLVPTMTQRDTRVVRHLDANAQPTQDTEDFADLVRRLQTDKSLRGQFIYFQVGDRDNPVYYRACQLWYRDLVRGVWGDQVSAEEKYQSDFRSKSNNEIRRDDLELFYSTYESLIQYHGFDSQKFLDYITSFFQLVVEIDRRVGTYFTYGSSEEVQGEDLWIMTIELTSQRDEPWVVIIEPQFSCVLGMEPFTGPLNLCTEDLEDQSE